MKTYPQRRSQIQERRAAEDTGSRVQKGSGSSDFAKSDTHRVLELRGECKGTSNKSYSLKLNELHKIREEALTGGLENWHLQIEFWQQFGTAEKFAVIGWERYIELLEYEKQCRGTP